MKKSILLVMLLAGGVMFTSCKNQEPANVQTPVEGDMATVKFAVGSQDGFQAATRAYDAAQLNVMKFKENTAGKFIYDGTVSFTSTTVNDDVIEGSTSLAFGNYKFVSTYGVEGSSAITYPTMTGAELGNAIAYSYAGAALPEMYMDVLALDAFTTYNVDYAMTDVVSSTLKRAVGRVDLMFVRADKSGSAYTDKGTPAFGNNNLGKIEASFTGLTNNVNLVGGAAATQGTTTKDFTSTTFITGNGTATSVGESGYQGYNAIAAGDLNNGSLYVVGDFVLPNNTASSNVNLSVDLIEATDAAGAHARTLNFNNLPIERNKVTLVKVYILTDDPFLAPVEFEVTLVNDYDEPIIVTGELE